MTWLPPPHPSPYNQAATSTLLPANPSILIPLHSKLFSAWTMLSSMFTWMIISNPSCLSLDVFFLGMPALIPSGELSVLHLGLLSLHLLPFIIVDTCLILPLGSKILKGRGCGFNFCICNTYYSFWLYIAEFKIRSANQTSIKPWVSILILKEGYHCPVTSELS